MAVPTLTPASSISAIILPETGTTTDVNDGCTYKIYSDPTSDLYSADFLTGAAEQVTFVYRNIVGDVLDIELTANNVYTAYEQAVLEYSMLVNLYQARNVISEALGAPTGSFDSHGNIDGTDDASTKYPNVSFGYAQRIWDAVGNKAGFGGVAPVYSASFDAVDYQQDYDLQAIVSASAASGNVDYAGIQG
jgi:hypothetical protein